MIGIDGVGHGAGVRSAKPCAMALNVGIGICEKKTAYKDGGMEQVSGSVLLGLHTKILQNFLYTKRILCYNRVVLVGRFDAIARWCFPHPLEQGIGHERTILL